MKPWYTTVSNGQFYQLTINAAPGMNEAQLDKLMMDKINEVNQAKKPIARSVRRWELICRY